MIANSDNAQSMADADSYIARRGLNAANRLNFSFGTANLLLFSDWFESGPACTSAPYVGQKLYSVIANYLATHEIDAVILSTFTPARIDFGGQVVFMVPAAFVAAIPNYIATGGAQPQYFDDVVYNATLHNSIQAIQANVCRNWRPGNARNARRLIPHGRLGMPDCTSALIGELPTRSGLSAYESACRAADAGQALDNTNATHIASDTAATATVSAGDNLLGISQMRQLAMLNTLNKTSADFVTAAGGSITGVSRLFALCIGTSFNPAAWVVNGALSDSFTCEPGAWGYVFTSSSFRIGYSILYNGGAAAVCTAGEPLAGNIPAPQELFIHASTFQIPLMLAHFLAHGTNQGSTVCGDPLYIPYKSTGVIPPKPICTLH